MNAQASPRTRCGSAKTKDYRDPEAKAWARLGIEDPHQVLGDNATRNPGKNGGSAGYSQSDCHRPNGARWRSWRPRTAWTKAEVRKSYKALIKVLHPDINGGDRSRRKSSCKLVVWAWDQIKDSRNFK